MSEPNREPILDPLERALGSLIPTAGRLGRDELVFRAGQASVRRGWFWPGATALFAISSAGLGLFALGRPGPQALCETQYVRVEVPAPSADTTARHRDPSPSPGRPDGAERARTDYVRLEQQLLRWGLDALPGLPPDAAAVPPAQHLDPAVGPPVDTESPGWNWLPTLFKLGERS
jgi:hypothetical protein